MSCCTSTRNRGHEKEEWIFGFGWKVLEGRSCYSQFGIRLPTSNYRPRTLSWIRVVCIQICKLVLGNLHRTVKRWFVIRKSTANLNYENLQRFCIICRESKNMPPKWSEKSFVSFHLSLLLKRQESSQSCWAILEKSVGNEVRINKLNQKNHVDKLCSVEV